MFAWECAALLALLLLVPVLPQTHHKTEAAAPTTGWYAGPRNSPTTLGRVIVVDSRWFGDPPGGVEAMIQLSIALAAATSRDEVFVSGYGGLSYNEKWKRAYGDKLVTKVRAISDLKRGDIVFFNEGMGCSHGPANVPEGVFVYIYLLAAYRGCKDAKMHFISHNHYLLNFENLHLPKERLIHPYLNENFTYMAHLRGLQHDGSISFNKMRYKSKKRNLILVDDDVPESVKRMIVMAAESSGGKALVLTGLNNEQLIDAYESAKMATDWCMRGSERCMLEASLFGALVTTNRCETGSDFQDLPIPAKFIYNHTDDSALHSDAKNEELYNSSSPLYQRLLADLMHVVSHGFSNYWDLVDDYEPLRRSILSHNPSSMVRESVRFLSSHGLSQDMLGQLHGGQGSKCVGC